MHSKNRDYHIYGIFGSEFNLVVWQIFDGLPNLNCVILKLITYFICAAHIASFSNGKKNLMEIHCYQKKLKVLIKL